MFRCKLINARSLNNKINDLRYLLDNDQLDLLCCCETWLQPSTPDSVIVANTDFSIFRKDRLHSIGGGVCILINNSTITAVDVPLLDEFCDLEIVCVDIVNTSIPTRVIACYRPPSTDTDCDAILHMKMFDKCLEFLCDVDSTIVIAGDINLPYVDWSNPILVSDTDRCSTIFTTFTSSYALNQCVSEPTRYNLNSSTGVTTATLIDLVLCNDNFAVNNVAVEAPFSRSDHCSVVFNIVRQVSPVNHDFSYRNFADADWDSINAALNDIDWNVIFNIY